MTLFELGQRFVGEVRELPGEAHDPFIQWCFTSCGYGPETPDEVPWCSAFVNRLCWQLRLPRSKSAAARSWLSVGQVIDLERAVVGFDVVILKRGEGAQPGPEVTRGAAGHVGFYAGRDPDGAHVWILGGNQADSVSLAKFKSSDVLGVRRLL